MARRNESAVETSLNIIISFVYMLIGLGLGFGLVGLSIYGLYRLITG